MKKRILIFLLPVLLSATTAFSMGLPRITAYSGDVKAVPDDIPIGTQCYVGMTLAPGTWVNTGASGQAEITFDDEGTSTIILESNSVIVIKNKPTEAFELMNGGVFTKLSGFTRTEPFIIKTYAGTCGATGTSWYTLCVNSTAFVNVLENKVFVRGYSIDGFPLDDTVWVKAGKYCSVRAYKPPAPSEDIPIEVLDRMNKLSDSLASSSVVTQMERNVRIAELKGRGVSEDLLSTYNTK
ncbi:MAG: FecR domain-containing protein [Candidatus Omnitrophica bacterium]|nr:FecR domain-containing protein [Candidatus Omnitrophota bacterium]